MKNLEFWKIENSFKEIIIIEKKLGFGIPECLREVEMINSNPADTPSKSNYDRKL